MGCAFAIQNVKIDDLSHSYKELILDKCDLDNCRIIWEKILLNTTPPFDTKRTDVGFQWTSCSDWFSAVLYEHLFFNCPHARRMFATDISRVGNRTIVKMISKCLYLMELIGSSCETDTGRSCTHSPSHRSVASHSIDHVLSNEENAVLAIQDSPNIDQDVDIPIVKGRGVSSFPLSLDNPISDYGSIGTSPKAIASADVFSRQMKIIAASHHQMGVRGIDFCFFGDALLEALRTVCGDVLLTDAMELSWRNLYSAILHAILDKMPESSLPIAESEEESHSSFYVISQCRHHL